MSHRRLADIVGYTAMMQRNEQAGLAKVRRFSAVMEEQVEAHHGEIRQFMGDGWLCIFHSAVQAFRDLSEKQDQEYFCDGVAEALLVNNPFSVLAKTNLSRINLWTGNYERVLEVTEKTLQEHPRQSSAMRHRGEAFLMLGKNEAALGIFEELSSILNYANYANVIALNRLGKKEESRLAFQQARPQMVATHQALFFVEYQQIDSAFYYLEKGIREKTVAALFRVH
jgi:tetratricopeptide (TPR) repeat protein